MRPLRLEIDGLRSYRAKNTIDFTGRDLCGVVGDTGSGKSSILEAMVFALYGGSTFTKQAGSLVCDARDQMRVALDFLADGSRWRVERVMWHREASSKPSAHKLEELGADGSPIRTISDRNRINPMIEQLIGLNRDAFLKSVLLPQGRFAELLTSTPTVRSDIFKSIFALDELEQCAEEIKQLAEQAGTAMQVVRVRRRDLGEDPAGAAAAAKAAAEQATAALEAVDKVLAQMQEAVDEAAKAEAESAEQGRHAATVQATLTALDELGRKAGFAYMSRDQAFDAIEQTRATIAADIGAATEAEQAARKQQQQISDQLAARETEGLGQADLARTQSALGQLPGLATRWAAAATERTALEATRDTTTTALTAAEEELSTALDDCESAEAALAEDRQQATAARDRLVEAARRVDQAVAAMATEQAAREEAVQRRAKVERAEATAEEAQQAVQEAEAAMHAAREHERHAATADHAAAVAAELSAGDTCPVCTSTVPEGFSRPAPAEAVQQAAAAVEGAELVCTAKRAAQQRATTAAARMRSEAESCEKAHEEKAAASAAAMDRLHSLLPTVGPADLHWRAEQTVADPVTLRDDPLLGSLAAAVRPVDEGPVVDARRQAEKAAGTAQRLRQELDEAQRGIDRCSRDARGAGNDLSAIAASVPSRFAPATLAEVASLVAEERPASGQVTTYASLDVEAAVRSVEAELRASRQLETDRAEAVAAADVAVSQRAASDQRMIAEVGRPLAAVRTQLQVAAAKLRDLPGATESGEIAPDDDIPAMRTQAESLVAAAQASLDVFNHARWTADERATTQQRRVVETVQNLLSDLDLPDARSAVMAQSARTAMDAHVVGLKTARAVANHEADLLAEQAAKAEMFDAAITEADPLVRALETLKRLLSRSRFIAHVVQQRQLHLLGVATERLREMTDGRYSFTAEFDLLDNLTGRARGADTLSGGEKFLASLALSLAMVEMAGRAGGKIDAIFLDEGFGALDSDSLDEALDLLEAQAADGRLLVVISHIKAVAERIQSVLHVTNDATGASSAYWLTDEQRAAFVHDEAANAVSGLLS